eukprot:TRINITY_DN3758_c0_g2_i3.p2 TRINITY_DN3758_c0_g2~~TRINITY_DN3758_c0_g2_i3.p2  ORF type:complete len:114 (-),score=11.81 TRINITY_DN3758_c0_g2_i3:17-358(-)
MKKSLASEHGREVFCHAFEHKVVRPEELSERTSTNTVHGTWFQIHENCTRHISTAGSFVEIHIDAFKLKVRISMVCSCRVDTMLIGDDFPKLGSNLIPTLATLNVDKFAHVEQ